jgi:hypothetical protein
LLFDQSVLWIVLTEISRYIARLCYSTGQDINYPLF